MVQERKNKGTHSYTQSLGYLICSVLISQVVHISIFNISLKPVNKITYMKMYVTCARREIIVLPWSNVFSNVTSFIPSLSYHELIQSFLHHVYTEQQLPSL